MVMSTLDSSVVNDIFTNFTLLIVKIDLWLDSVDNSLWVTPVQWAALKTSSNSVNKHNVGVGRGIEVSGREVREGNYN